MHIHAQIKSGSDSKVDESYQNFYHKFDHNCGLGVQGKLPSRTWHYPRCTGEAIVAYLALSKVGSRVHYYGRREDPELSGTISLLFLTRNLRKREEGGPRALGINFPFVFNEKLEGKGGVPGTIQRWI